MLFESEGSRGSSFSGGVFLVVLGVIGSLAMLVPGIVAPQMVGPWWIYATTLVGSIAAGVWLFRRDKALIRLLAERRLVITGPAVSLDVVLDAEVDHWISFVKGPHVGAAKLVQYNAVVRGGGKRLGLWNLAGAQGSEPRDWPVRDSGVGGCDE